MTQINLSLTPEEIEWALRWYSEYPKSPVPEETVLVEKLKTALPKPTVQVTLTADQLDRIKDWHSWAENEGGASTYGDQAYELNRVLKEARDRL